MWKTRLTELLGIDIPVVQGTMQWLSTAPFVAAVSNAGGLGTLSSATFSKEKLRDEIKKTKTLTQRPFAVNINLFPTLRVYSVEEMIDVCHDEGVGILETSGRSPEPYMKRLKEGNTVHIHKCARVRDGVKAEALGANVVAIVGFECGGHPSHEEISTLVLLSRLTKMIGIPAIAGGGFADGRGLMAALSLGAEGIVLGTRLMATKECPIHPEFKKALVEADINSTTILLRSVKDHRRVFFNKAAQNVLEMEKEGVALEEIYQAMAGQRSLEAYESGDIQKGIFPCGQAAGLIREIPPVRDVFQKIIEEADEIRRRWTE